MIVKGKPGRGTPSSYEPAQTERSRYALGRLREPSAERGELACPVVRMSSQTTDSRSHDCVFNMSVRKFLKNLGVTAQREIELSVREQLEAGDLRGDETLEATVTVDLEPPA